jgi:hypothetical protein
VSDKPSAEASNAHSTKTARVHSAEAANVHSAAETANVHSAAETANVHSAAESTGVHPSAEATGMHPSAEATTKPRLCGNRYQGGADYCGCCSTGEFFVDHGCPPCSDDSHPFGFNALPNEQKLTILSRLSFTATQRYSQQVRYKLSTARSFSTRPVRLSAWSFLPIPPQVRRPAALTANLTCWANGLILPLLCFVLCALCRFSAAGNRRTSHALMRPAAEKRQCTKSRREVARWCCRRRYGDVTTARDTKAG